jgi:hypothetical protein
MSDGTSSTHLLLGGLALFLVVAAVALLWAYGKCHHCYKWNNTWYQGPEPTCDTYAYTPCGKKECKPCPTYCNLNKDKVEDPGKSLPCNPAKKTGEK